jgi:hypothetical protein
MLERVDGTHVPTPERDPFSVVPAWVLCVTSPDGLRMERREMLAGVGTALTAGVAGCVVVARLPQTDPDVEWTRSWTTASAESTVVVTGEVWDDVSVTETVELTIEAVTGDGTVLSRERLTLDGLTEGATSFEVAVPVDPDRLGRVADVSVGAVPTADGG